MKRIMIILMSLLFVFALSTVSQAVVLDFEDLIGSGSMPDPYDGIIDWENGTWFHYDWDQPPYYPSSGIQRTYESTTDYTPSWDFLADVVYVGSYFSGRSEVDATVQMDLYLDSSMVYSTGVFAPSEIPTFFATGYSGLVDRVVINTPTPDYWVMDDLTYETAVPEPTTMILLGSGLIGLAGLRRKFKN